MKAPVKASETIIDPDEDPQLYSSDFASPYAEGQAEEGLEGHSNDPITGLPPPPSTQLHVSGTLVVRVVAGRDIPAAVPGGIAQVFNGGSDERQRQLSGPRSRRVLRMLSPGVSNPYVNVRFGGVTQTMQQVWGTCDPVWPRESAFFDVVHGGEMGEGSVLEIELMHTDDDYGAGKGKGKKGGKMGKAGGGKGNGDYDRIVTPLGTCRIHVLSVLTGRADIVDDWFPLPGQGALRVVVEYETSGDPPRAGDICRISDFCPPKDLFPIVHDGHFEVDEVDGDLVILKYTTDEDWVCTFALHRNCVVVVIRRRGAVEAYSGAVMEAAKNLAISPAVEVVVDVATRELNETGLVGVGAKAAAGGIDLINRWWNGGTDLVVEDIVYATNWDGRLRADDDEEDEDEDSEEAQAAAKKDAEYSNDLDKMEALEGMPCCPITKEPMREPVVAADGHTYERRAILRWLETSDCSPLTGTVLAHKDVVVNFSLIDRCREAAIQAAKDANEKDMAFVGAGGTEEIISDEDERKPAAMNLESENAESPSMNPPLITEIDNIDDEDAKPKADGNAKPKAIELPAPPSYSIDKNDRADQAIVDIDSISESNARDCHDENTTCTSETNPKQELVS